MSSKTAILDPPLKTEEGLTLFKIYNLLKIEDKEFAAILGISDRNLKRWIDDPRLAEDSYRFQMLKEIITSGVEVIREDKLGNWLTRPQNELGNYRPVTLMREIQGFKDVLHLLGSMRAGTYA